MKTPAELQKQLRETATHLTKLMCEVEDRYEGTLLEVVYARHYFEKVMTMLKEKLESTNATYDKSNSSNAEIEVANKMNIEIIGIQFYVERYLKSWQQHTNDEEITPQLLIQYGFDGSGHSYKYRRICNTDDNSVLIISTAKKEMNECKYVECYNGIKLYTLNDLKMLWFLLTREELIEVR